MKVNIFNIKLQRLLLLKQMGITLFNAIELKAPFNIKILPMITIQVLMAFHNFFYHNWINKKKVNRVKYYLLILEEELQKRKLLTYQDTNIHPRTWNLNSDLGGS